MSAFPLSPARQRAFYAQMVLIRRFEEAIVRMAKEQGRLPGMQILAVGQEAVAVGVVAALEDGDVIVSNHRSHGHLLARGADPDVLMAEIMGKAAGVNSGKAGTLHLAVPEVGAILTSTVVGAGPPLAAGAAFAQHYRSADRITVVFFGDGAAAEGSVHEAMNLAGLWRLPLLFVCENNGWAGAQKPAEHCAVTDICRRGEAYAMPGVAVDGNDVEAVLAQAAELVAHCRSGRGPALLEARTYRMRGHGERDPQHYVDSGELARWAERCPLATYRRRLVEAGAADAAAMDAAEQDAAERVTAAVAFADASPYPEPSAALHHLWAAATGR